MSRSGLIVADDVNHRLSIFDTGGRFIRTVGVGEGNQPDELQNPYDVAVDPSGRVYVADNSNHRIVRYGPAPTYKYRARWSSFGPQPGHVQFPRGIAVDAAGKSFVADPGGNRIDMFDSGGASLGAFGADGRASGQFIRPLGVGADAGGTARSRTRSTAASCCSIRMAASPRCTARRRRGRRCCRTRWASRSTPPG